MNIGQKPSCFTLTLKGTKTISDLLPFSPDMKR